VHYRLSYTDEAERALNAAPGFYRQRFRRAIEGLARDPRPANAEKMREPDRYKIKFDRWRLIYSIHDEESVIRILRIRQKEGPETYQNLEDPDQ
jgi:mRNA-degrading endonuclease RelE of RelBE toxin-antitoxin system